MKRFLVFIHGSFCMEQIKMLPGAAGGEVGQYGAIVEFFLCPNVASAMIRTLNSLGYRTTVL